jgi:hypothetical protein
MDQKKYSYDQSRKIKLAKGWELNHWCEEFNLRAEELKEIVKRVGNNPEKVKRFMLDRHKLH